MTTAQHALLGAAVACAPDLVLATFGWRRVWLPATHPLVRVHRWIHSPAGLFAVCWASHVVADWLSPHRTGPEAQ